MQKESMKMQQVVRKQYPENIRTDVFVTLMNHPIQGIPRVYSIEGSPNGWIVSEEFIPGRTLAEVLRFGLFETKNAVNVCLQLCEILEQLHAFGIVHGDIKPDNIIFADNGMIYLIDFDASHFVKDEIGRDTVLLGTPGFASPEQFGFGRSDPRSDIYAIGVLLNVMITGQHPLYKTASGRIAIAIEKCIDVDPERRYQNIRELKQGLRHPRKRHEFLPPGFRSGSPGKMILAIFGYASILLLLFVALRPGGSYSGPGAWIINIWLAVSLIGIIFILFNYGGINGIFSKDKQSKHVGAKILEIFLFLIITAVIAIVVYGLFK